MLIMRKEAKEMLVWKDRVKLRLRERKGRHTSITEKRDRETSTELNKSRREFYKNVKRLDEMEKDSISVYLKDFIAKNARGSRFRSIRTMPIDQEEQLLKYVRKNSPELKQLNLSTLSCKSKEFPANCYTKTVKVNSKKNFLNRTSVVWDMYEQANLNSSERIKLELLSKRTRKVINFALTKHFMAKIDIPVATRDYSSALDKYPDVITGNHGQAPISEYNFHALVARLVIERLSLATKCQFFAFGHRGIFVPPRGTAVFLLDLYSNFSCRN
eukprot:TRINITY_DN12843_c0_g5_i2.p1 TRINITY_DN12843_c0_g5~~TRINITY_DN12843_c0_g5_i2.p1  ORF type:complete len:304 (+),score=77.32 TRINITY_DN12843_c0_g5_i2:99-914(+)